MQTFGVGMDVMVVNLYTKEYSAVIKGQVNYEKFNANYLIKFNEKGADKALKSKSATFPYEVVNENNLRLPLKRLPEPKRMEEPQPVPQDQDGEWRTGFFSVCAAPGGAKLCALAWCCPCIVFGQTMARMEPSEAFCGGNQNGACLSFIIFAVFGILGGITRTAIRKKYGIRGNLAQDILLWYCFNPCAIIQVQMHLISADNGLRMEYTYTVPHTGS